MTDRFQVIPAAYVLLLRGDLGAEEILLQLRSGTGYMDGLWAAGAAGHVEAGESVIEAGQREAAEELGIAIATGDLVPLCGMHRTGLNGQSIDERADFFFTCREWSGEPELRERAKAADLRWFPLALLPGEMVPHERRVMELLMAGPVPAIATFGFTPEEAARQEAGAGAR